MFACTVAYDILNTLQMTCPEEHPKLPVFSAGVYCYNKKIKCFVSQYIYTHWKYYQAGLPNMQVCS